MPRILYETKKMRPERLEPDEWETIVDTLNGGTP